MKPKAKRGMYGKVRPGNPHLWDWYCKVKVGNGHEAVSLRLVANDGGRRELNVRLAETRRDAVRSEVRAGVLSSVLEWMLPKQAERLQHKMAVGKLKPSTDRPATWDEARDQWLATYRAKRIDAVEGKINVTNDSDDKRVSRIGEFIRYVKDMGGGIMGADINGLFIGFYKSRVGRWSGQTIDKHFSHLAPFGDFLVRKGLCVPLDRVAIRQSFPPLEPVKVVVPDWQADLRAMRELHEHRHDSVRLWSAWGLYLIVRGLGCRPDEAAHLSWETVDLSRETVTFRDTKENRQGVRGDRVVPILFDWVRDGLIEMKEVHDRRQPDTLAVCLTRTGSYFRHQQTTCDTSREARKALGLPADYQLKKAQKAHIAQLRSMKVPDTRIAALTGHTLETFIKHYVKGETYDRLDRHDYQEFGRLSENGNYWMREWGARHT